MNKFLDRLFEPISLTKYRSLKLVSESTLAATWYDFVPIFFIPYLTTLIQNGDRESALELITYLSIFYIVAWLLNYLMRAWDYEAKSHMEMALNEKYRRKIIQKDPQFMDKIGTGKVQSIVQKGFSAWVEVIWYFLYQAARVVAGLGAGIYLTIQMGNVYFIAFIFLSVLSAAGFTFFKLRQVKYRTEMNNIEDDLNKNYIRLIMSRQEVLFSDTGDKEVRKIKEYISEILKKVPNYARYDFLSDIFVSSMAIIIPLAGAAYIIFSGSDTMEAGMFLSLIYFSSRFTGIMYWLVWLVNQLVEKYPEMQKFWDFLAYIPEIKNYETGKKFVQNGGEIVLDNITFSYGGMNNKFFKKYDREKNNQEEEILTEEELEEKQEVEKTVLKNFNLHIAAGQKIALVGKSGSGKTTIAKLISGLVVPVDGQVLVDGQNLQKVSLKSYFTYLGYLTQEPSVFDGSIKENLLYSVKRKVTDEEINNALLQANCSFVFGLRKGINTEIGERGIRLSGGERQRLAIAKLFLKNPEIIILDEPTSALDSFSEEKISQSLEELFKGRTTIIIAHRLQTVKKADRILVLENGRIIEDGTHESLVELGGSYAKMLAMQSGF